MAKANKVIGLTGGIGSGKSTVSDLFAQLGVPIIDTDVIAKELTQKNQPALQVIVKHLGESILNTDGSLNRQQLRKHIFNNQPERHWLENLLHPLIRERVQQQLQAINAPYVIVVIPLLHDRAKFDYVNRVLVVDAPETLQIKRACQRDNMNEKLAQAILDNQISRQDRLALADDVIVNDKTLDALKKQVELLHRQYSSWCLLNSNTKVVTLVRMR